MDVELATKFALALFSILTAVVGAKYSNAQSKKISAELMEKFDAALQQERKLLACELFRTIYGITLDYEDIRLLSADNRVGQIILALQNRAGVVQHKDGKLQYTPLFKKPWIRRIDSVLSNLIVWGSGLLCLVSPILLAVSEGLTSFLMLGALFVSTWTFVLQLRSRRRDDMVKGLVGDRVD